MPKKYRNRKSLNHRLPSHKGGAGKYPRQLLDKNGRRIFQDAPPTPAAKAAADAKLNEGWGVDGEGAAVDGVDWKGAAAHKPAGGMQLPPGVAGPAQGAELAGVSSWDDDDGTDWSAAPVGAGDVHGQLGPDGVTYIAVPPGVPAASSPPTVAPTVATQGAELTDSASSWDDDHDEADDDGTNMWMTPPRRMIDDSARAPGNPHGYGLPTARIAEPGILDRVGAAASSAIDAVSDAAAAAGELVGLTEKDAPPPVYTGAPHWRYPDTSVPVGPHFNLLDSSETLLDSAPRAGAAGTASPQSGEPKGYSPVRRSAPPIFSPVPRDGEPGGPIPLPRPIPGSEIPISDDWWPGGPPSRSRNIYTPRKKRRKSSKRKRKPHRSHKLSRRKIKKQITKKKRELKILRKKLSKSKK
jgi:hypothetical protein